MRPRCGECLQKILALIIQKPGLYAGLTTKTCVLLQIRWSLSKHRHGSLVPLFATHNFQLVLSNLHLKLLLNPSIKITMTVTAKYKKSKEKEKEKTQPLKRRMAPNVVIMQSREKPHSHVTYTSREGGSSVQTNLSRTCNSHPPNTVQEPLLQSRRERLRKISNLEWSTGTQENLSKSAWKS